jgi:NAD(P)-dependent dehydrogenase (short-subunit alcohol dehydrogenase family)
MIVDGFLLKGRTVLVTGASRGIGRAVAEAFCEAGAWVGLIARGEGGLREVADAVGGHAIPADVSSPQDVNRLADYVVDLLGTAPDILVNAAGAFELAPFAETDPARFERIVASNLHGPFLMIRAFLPLMLQRRSGHVIDVGSVAGRVPLPGNAAYGASKYGLRGLHEVLAEEIRGTGIRSTLVEPAATDTSLWDPLDPDRRTDLPSRVEMLRPADVARVVLFAASQPPGVEIPLVSVRAAH